MPTDLRTTCPCGSGEPLWRCCGPLHAGAGHAKTAEQLMRSRYSAHVVGDASYLLRTWHPRTRPANLDLSGDVTWTALQVTEVVAGGPKDDSGVVAFTASFTVDGHDDALVERSTFTRRGGRWLYVDGEHPDD